MLLTTPQPTPQLTASPAKKRKTCNVGAYLIWLHDFDLANGLFSFHEEPIVRRQ
jgi:hypothetical protein